MHTSGHGSGHVMTVSGASTACSPVVQQTLSVTRTTPANSNVFSILIDSALQTVTIIMRMTTATPIKRGAKPFDSFPEPDFDAT